MTTPDLTTAYLEELEGKCDAALTVSANGPADEDSWFMPQHFANLEPEDAAFIAALNPQTAKALIHRARVAGDWQDIGTAPRDGTSFMVWVEGDPVMGSYAFAPLSITRDGHWFDDSTGDRIEALAGITHWRPLPAPPSQALSRSVSISDVTAGLDGQAAKVLGSTGRPS